MFPYRYARAREGKIFFLVATRWRPGPEKEKPPKGRLSRKLAIDQILYLVAGARNQRYLHLDHAVLLAERKVAPADLPGRPIMLGR